MKLIETPFANRISVYFQIIGLNITNLTKIMRFCLTAFHFTEIKSILIFFKNEFNCCKEISVGKNIMRECARNETLFFK